jgi:hypothetical protein
MLDKNIVEEYIELKRIIKESTARLEELQEELKTSIEVGKKTPEVNGGVIYHMEGKAKFIYTPALVEMEKSLKEKKKLEEQTGVAQLTKGEPYLMVKLSK